MPEEIRGCPFCSPSADDIVLLETQYARAMIDSCPIMPGHILVASKEHSPSAIDLDPYAYAHLRLVQQEVAYRLHHIYGTVGVYEHGRSKICRFHDYDYQEMHAHLHLLPACLNIVAEEIHEDISSDNAGRYLYQEIGSNPIITMHYVRGSIRRHYLRNKFQNLLTELELPWQPLSLTYDDHSDTVDETEQYFKSKSMDGGIVLSLPQYSIRTGQLTSYINAETKLVCEVDLLNYLYELMQKHPSRSLEFWKDDIPQKIRRIWDKSARENNRVDRKLENLIQLNTGDSHLPPSLFYNSSSVQNVIDWILNNLTTNDEAVVITSRDLLTKSDATKIIHFDSNIRMNDVHHFKSRSPFDNPSYPMIYENDTKRDNWHTFRIHIPQLTTLEALKLIDSAISIHIQYRN